MFISVALQDDYKVITALLNKALDEVRLLDALLAESNTGIQTVQFNQGLVSALSLLSDLAKQQRSVDELVESDESRKRHMGQMKYSPAMWTSFECSKPKCDQSSKITAGKCKERNSVWH